MASWSCLPPEIKQHVVKRLDFMSRHSLRHTSRLDRQIVDSTKCQVPRVRFGYKEGRGLIVVYTGIDQFLRIEMEKSKDGILVTKSDSTYDPHLAAKTELEGSSNQDLIFMMIRIFHFLFNHDSIDIKVMEFELPTKNEELEKQIPNLMTKSLIDRIDEFVFDNLKYVVREVLFEIVIKPEKKKTVRVLKLMVSSEGTVPRIAVDDWKDEESVTYVSTIIEMKKKKENEPIMRSYQKIFAKPSKDELEAHFTIRVPNGRIKPVAGRQEYGDLVEWVKNTECGQVVRVVRQCDEERFLKDSKGCGLGDLCKRCSDPFDYWYTQNLPRRLHFEPFWDGIISRLPQEDFENETWKLRLKIEEEESHKPVEKKKKKASWGFETGKGSSDYTVTEKPSSTVDSENNISSTVVQENDDHLESTVIPGNDYYLKYLVILFVSPILLTFFISFFFQLKW